ncbi:MAG: sigma-70 family RNA polymerase sigma factor [Oscillospiraceae bacterium]|nr:sigma-70 family RNA polymerase sigma factor [Oscillospiraceae bacterium]
MQDDSRIIALLKKRDEQAIKIIREQYGTMCLQIAYRITGSHEDAEECVDDMLITVWNTIPPMIPEKLPAYLVSLISRKAIDKYERACRQKRGGTQFESALDELAEFLPSGECVEQQVEQRELTNYITEWLRSLPSGHKRIFMQRYYWSESVQEIAQANQMSDDAVKMQLMRLRTKLKEYLRKEGLL